MGKRRPDLSSGPRKPFNKEPATVSKTRKAMDLRAEADTLVGSGRASDGFRARHLEEQASELLTLTAPPILSHGEALPAEYNDEVPVLYDTLEQPADMIAVDASLERQRLVCDAGGLELALDLNQTIGARNSIEKMLMAQAAALHAAGMNLLGKANGEGQAAPIVELVRLTNSAVRCFEGSHGAILTVNQVRGASKVQRIVVQHVEVQNGGQAVVVPQMPPREVK